MKRMTTIAAEVKNSNLPTNSETFVKMVKCIVAHFNLYGKLKTSPWSVGFVTATVVGTMRKYLKYFIKRYVKDCDCKGTLFIDYDPIGGQFFVGSPGWTLTYELGESIKPTLSRETTSTIPQTEMDLIQLMTDKSRIIHNAIFRAICKCGGTYPCREAGEYFDRHIGQDTYSCFTEGVGEIVNDFIYRVIDDVVEEYGESARTDEKLLMEIADAELDQNEYFEKFLDDEGIRDKYSELDEQIKNKIQDIVCDSFWETVRNEIENYVFEAEQGSASGSISEKSVI